MVFKDNELIMTKRVNRIRKSQDTYKTRVWRAKGDYAYAFTVFTFIAMSQQFNNIALCSFLPSMATLSAAGFRQYARHTGKYLLLPAFVGHFMGLAMFADVLEYGDLTRNHLQYKR